MQLTCEYKPVLFVHSLHKTSINYCEPPFPNHLRENKTRLVLMGCGEIICNNIYCFAQHLSSTAKKKPKKKKTNKTVGLEIFNQSTANETGYNLRTFAPIATAHLYCARYSLVTRVPRHFQTRAPSRKLSKL